ncbi:activator of HSP90 ATPase [Amycolatopsis sp. NBRC 101858]|uniref:SRPBCC family protein n=1 Tax=Amycolatopsis sp. NBRC 101858 TaxID=3032200 RepID=UPI0024A45C6A|nr:SRPBCC family protein [Amycolatopsis sp. NBRC 101858]GLY44221.1 activator of HSP90 ATPase [Amycolatopsis sp. NBRC 101858]
MSTTITARPGTPFIEITREFAAPPSAVLRAHTDPELIVRWLGPHGMEMEIVEFDARSGGAYDYIHRDERGEYRFRGVYHTVSADRIVQTFEYLGAPGEVTLDSMTLTEAGGHTRVETRSVFPSVEARDAALESGMSRGITESYERLDKVLAD